MFELLEKFFNHIGDISASSNRVLKSCLPVVQEISSAYYPYDQAVQKVRAMMAPMEAQDRDTLVNLFSFLARDAQGEGDVAKMQRLLMLRNDAREIADSL